MQDQLVKEAYGSAPAYLQPDDYMAYFNHLKLKYPNPPEYKTPTHIGIEVEIEKVQKGVPVMMWRADKDGSLRDGGVEFISKPLKDELLILGIQELYDDLWAINKKADFSHRCSIHVHMDVTKLKLNQLKVLIATYICLEELFFSLVQAHRKANSFCFPLQDALLKWEDMNPHNLDAHFKYCALNPHHLRDYGTIEFRHHGGTKDKAVLLQWIETILQLYHYVNKRSVDEITSTIKKLNTISNYNDFARDVLEHRFEPFMDIDLHKLMRNGVAAAKIFLG
jgi:hypothetical protein